MRSPTTKKTNRSRDVASLTALAESPTLGDSKNRRRHITEYEEESDDSKPLNEIEPEKFLFDKSPRTKRANRLPPRSITASANSDQENDTSSVSIASFVDMAKRQSAPVVRRRRDGKRNVKKSRKPINKEIVDFESRDDMDSHIEFRSESLSPTRRIYQSHEESRTMVEKKNKNVGKEHRAMKLVQKSTISISSTYEEQPPTASLTKQQKKKKSSSGSVSSAQSSKSPSQRMPRNKNSSAFDWPTITNRAVLSANEHGGNEVVLRAIRTALNDISNEAAESGQSLQQLLTKAGVMASAHVLKFGGDRKSAAAATVAVLGARDTDAGDQNRPSELVPSSILPDEDSSGVQEMVKESPLKGRIDTGSVSKGNGTHSLPPMPDNKNDPNPTKSSSSKKDENEKDIKSPTHALDMIKARDKVRIKDDPSLDTLFHSVGSSSNTSVKKSVKKPQAFDLWGGHQQKVKDDETIHTIFERLAESKDKVDRYSTEPEDMLRTFMEKNAKTAEAKVGDVQESSRSIDERSDSEFEAIRNGNSNQKQNVTLDDFLLIKKRKGSVASANDAVENESVEVWRDKERDVVTVQSDLENLQEVQNLDHKLMASYGTKSLRNTNDNSISSVNSSVKTSEMIQENDVRGNSEENNQKGNTVKLTDDIDNEHLKMYSLRNKGNDISPNEKNEEKVKQVQNVSVGFKQNEVPDGIIKKKGKDTEIQKGSNSQKSSGGSATEMRKERNGKVFETGEEFEVKSSVRGSDVDDGTFVMNAQEVEVYLQEGEKTNGTDAENNQELLNPRNVKMKFVKRVFNRTSKLSNPALEVLKENPEEDEMPKKKQNAIGKIFSSLQAKLFGFRKARATL